MFTPEFVLHQLQLSTSCVRGNGHTPDLRRDVDSLPGAYPLGCEFVGLENLDGRFLLPFLLPLLYI
jgi:hypothetical protein